MIIRGWHLFWVAVGLVMWAVIIKVFVHVLALMC